ncbi:uncharacterized protein L969DRAFT_42188 [Mixia osmundae IAM 14324]|uniref:Uncharacterized protein n=1 Tax=Mixia osmundae (strain CBS 9802 / IAM 14324 / JCM 22182 / KY 12970) TaxID=764103 RepID=G7E093_MIXOS|nr:uncharacterized protein L969DRAFT_42188 [Mixia osmundae IAM 14324]KEI42243.1 hypothetical protein L969DRAFT_42188 [Mixia osmundae IAM 14324]GAA96253.1 hypothetical protein E5Q_02917 [Mixia osmundae IAM 14324]
MSFAATLCRRASAAVSAPRRLTGLQKSIYALYRRSLRMVLNKPKDNRLEWYLFVQHQFRSPSLGGGLTRRQIGAIEYYIRKGNKQLELLEQDSIRTVHVPDEAHDMLSRGFYSRGWIVNRAA